MNKKIKIWMKKLIKKEIIKKEKENFRVRDKYRKLRKDRRNKSSDKKG